MIFKLYLNKSVTKTYLYIHVYLTFKKKSFYYHKFPEVEGPIDRVN